MEGKVKVVAASFCGFRQEPRLIFLPDLTIKEVLEYFDTGAPEY